MDVYAWDAILQIAKHDYFSLTFIRKSITLAKLNNNTHESFYSVSQINIVSLATRFAHQTEILRR